MYWLYIFVFLHQTATRIQHIQESCELYIFVFLHQTATYELENKIYDSCISLFSYIKPQLSIVSPVRSACCISLFSYIKPQPKSVAKVAKAVVYLCFPTSNRNQLPYSNSSSPVVYLCFPTSNRNRKSSYDCLKRLYIFVFLHQTATLWLQKTLHIGCISLFSYIKPQLGCVKLSNFIVVYLCFPTSNRNSLLLLKIRQMLYIFVFLHQTATTFS